MKRRIQASLRGMDGPGAAAPFWAVILGTASEWGVSPWDITGEEPNEATRLLWVLRHTALASEVATHHERQLSKAKKRGR